MLPRSEKLAYGSGQLGILAFDFFIRLYLLIFFTDVVGLEGRWAGLAVGVAVLWDAVTDPLMGNYSDSFHARTGKRRIWFLWGAVLGALVLVFLFSAGDAGSQVSKFTLLLVTYLLLNTVVTIYDIPYAAFGGDLSDDRHERTEIFGWRLGFGNVGAILGVAIPGVLLSLAVKDAYFWSALGVGALLLCSAFTCYFFTRDREPRMREMERAWDWNPFKNFHKVFANPHFRILLTAYFLATFGLAVNSSLALYYYRYRLELAEWQTQTIITVFIFVFTLSIAFWILISRKFGKKIPLIGGIFLLGLSGSFVYLFAPVGSMWLPLIYAIFAGVLIGSVVLLDSFLVDIIDYDRLQSGESRMGLYFGYWRMSSKLTRALAIAIAGVLIDRIGLQAGEPASEEASRSLALLFGPGVNLFFMAGAVVAVFMKYDDAAHEEVQALLLKRDKEALQSRKGD